MVSTADIRQALFGGWSQQNRFLRLTTSLGARALVAESLQGWEAIDHGGFRLQVSALSERADLPLAQVMGAPVLIEWQAAEGGDARRPLHGHVVEAELVGYNGGLARYRFVVEPWLALLRQRVDSYNYHDASVIEISEQIFRYHTRGAVAPAWRWTLGDRSKYRKRSLSAQAGESDFDFLARLWAEEGIFYWFEHAGDAGSSSFGEHTLVLADSNQRFTPDDPEMIGFHQTSDGEPQGSVQHFMPAQRWRIGSVVRASWDHRSLSTRPTGARANGAVVPGVDRDVAGPYAFQTGPAGDQRAQQQLDAQRVAAARSAGAGTRRDMRPGLRFALSQHPSLGTSDAFVCLRVQHEARANVDAQVHSAIARQLGAIPRMLDTHADEPGATTALHAALEAGTQGSGPLTDGAVIYRNQFLALPATQTYRPLADAGHGARSHPVAIAPGAQTAITVGAGNPIHTDRDHRIRIQHHAQRGQNAASREDHPYAANAPADQRAGTWTRMLTPVGGGNWGGVSIPRVGQEVWTEWLEGQPDRPVAVAALYNGQGHADAQHNGQAGGPSGSTGNAAAWFAGNGHSAALTGFKTQDLSKSQQGTGGYRQFLLDDSAGQSAAHLYTTDHNSGLTLGHLKQIQDNQRQADRGYGAELKTDGAGALRGGSGMLISSANGVSQMDAGTAAQVLAQSRQTLQSLADTAQKHGAEFGAASAPAASEGELSSASAAGSAQASQLAALAGIGQTHDALGAVRQSGDASEGGGSGSAVAWSRPHVVAHGEQGVAAISAKSHVWVSGKETVLSAGQDLQLTAAGKTSVVANQGIALYTQGEAGKGRPVAGQGIALHAASGTVSVQAQNGGTLGASAQKAVTLASAQAAVNLQAPKRVLLNAAKAYLKMEGNGIEIGAPGNVVFHAASHTLTGPRSAQAQAEIARSAPKLCEYKARGADAMGAGTMSGA
ncbi:type VI secretion system Vgr family protein [Paraburkholderia silviterrae]|uniref:Type VI secretion system tip protein VgrG n=1 Tax=Paraburkholderia silviterrae TaxID=2528715 RepID=A0A4R5LXR6_9BURK|nr:type VI secretion system Vgr family protein [Paraburkholderia silviterrae]TDG16954.1 type VI secretion system tip protein VgrG [Paraburkholderia silviterrae]